MRVPPLAVTVLAATTTALLGIAGAPVAAAAPPGCSDVDGVLVNKMNSTPDGAFQTYSVESGDYIRESFYPLRAEYDQYCRWVADQLDTIRWGHEVTAV